MGGSQARASTSPSPTGTASGKTLAFNLPVLDAIARDPKARALYLYPTKALAQDQARSLTALGVPGVRPAIYDGDTPTEQRRQVRTWANAILIEPGHAPPRRPASSRPLGRRALPTSSTSSSTRPTCTAACFGSHVANVLRRLRRLAAVYGAEPQFLLASATIANPRRAGGRR